MAIVNNRPTPEGRALGAELARLMERTIADHQAVGGKRLPERCETCAYREGTEPNGCLPTVLDALKCTMEDEVFMCHEDPRPCRGWAISRLDSEGATTSAPWAFSKGVP